MKRKYSLFIGRWQCLSPHIGHIALIETELNKGNSVLIAIRDTERDEKNPYSIRQRKKALKKAFKKWGKRVKVIKIPDIAKVCFGRKVGYDIEEIKLSPELESISATEIRKRTKENKLWQ